jgi:hypothetical protein
MLDSIVQEYLSEYQDSDYDINKVKEALSKAFPICRYESKRTLKFLVLMGAMPLLCNDLHLSLADLGSFVPAKSTLTEGVLHCVYQSHFEILIYVNTPLKMIFLIYVLIHSKPAENCERNDIVILFYIN